MDTQNQEVAATSLLMDANALVLPVNVVSVARYYNVQLTYRSDLSQNISGFFYSGPLWDIIIVNAQHPKVRQRFTIAHELGHWYIGDDSTSFKGIHRDYVSGSEQDIDRFAAALLMPVSLLEKEITRCQSSAALADRFQVSRSAMNRRLLELDLSSSPCDPLGGANTHSPPDFADPSWEVCQLPEDERTTCREPLV